MAFPGNVKIWGADFSRARRSHWAMRELGLDDQIEREDVPINVTNGQLYGKDDDAKREFYRTKLHPNSQMPVMRGPQHGEGYTLFESLAINYYLVKQHGGPLGPQSVEEEAKIMQWSVWVISQCESACVNLMFSGMMKNKEKQAERRVPLLKSLERPLAALETWCSSHKYMLGDDRWSIADLNVASVLQWGFENGVDISQFPNMNKWYQESISRPAFGAKMKSKI